MIGWRRILARVCDEECECKVRLDAAMDILALSSSRLKGVIFAGPEDAIESAYMDIRIARLRFISARSDHRDVCQSTL